MKTTALAIAVLYLLPSGMLFAQEKRSTEAARSGMVPRPSVALDSSKQPGGVITFGAPEAALLSDDERITRRARLAAAQQGGRIHANAAQPRGSREDINGFEHPELFIPYELFDQLLWGLSTNAGRRQHAHAEYDARIRSFGYDVEKFWQTLESASQPYIDVLVKHPHGGTAFVSSHGNRIFVPVRREVCVARIEALQAARAQLGGKTFFDAFLYSVVAPQMHVVRATTSADLDDQLRFMAGGCK
jgi:hypothetical protein